MSIKYEKTIYCDGGGDGRVALFIEGEKNQPAVKHTDATTNNEAEWEALLYALEHNSERVFSPLSLILTIKELFYADTFHRVLLISHLFHRVY